MDDNYLKKRAATFRSLVLIYAGLFLCKAILPPNIKELGSSLPGAGFSSIAWLLAIDLMVLIISILFFGYFGEKLSEKYSIKKIFTITQVGWVICFGLIPFSSNFLQYSILYVTSAVFAGAYLPIAFTMVGDFYPPKKRGEKFGMINIGLIIGRGSGLILGTFMGAISGIGWRLAYGLGFILAVLAVEEYWRQGIIPDRGRFEPEFQDLEREVKYNYKITFTALKQLFLNKTIGVILISVLITGIATATLNVWGLIYLETSQLTVLSPPDAHLFATIFILIAGLGSFPGTMLGGTWGDTYHKAGKLRGRVIISLSGIILGLLCFFGFFLIPLFGSTTWELILSGFLILSLGFLSFLFITLPSGNRFAIYSEVCVPEVRASANALHGVMMNIGGIIGNLLLALSITGDVILPFHVALLIAFGLIGGVLWIIPFFTYPKDELEYRKIMTERRAELEKT